MKVLALVLAGIGAPVAAQTPLCAWNGAALVCPGQTMPGPLPLYEQQTGQLPPIADRIDRLNDQATLDRALALAQAEQAGRKAEAARQADASAAAGYCTGGEVLNTDAAEPGLELLRARCKAPRR